MIRYLLSHRGFTLLELFLASTILLATIGVFLLANYHLTGSMKERENQMEAMSEASKIADAILASGKTGQEIYAEYNQPEWLDEPDTIIIRDWDNGADGDDETFDSDTHIARVKISKGYSLYTGGTDIVTIAIYKKYKK